MSARRGAWAWPAVVAALVLVLPSAASAAGTYVIKAGFSTTGIIAASKGFKGQFWESDKRKFKLTVKGHHAKTTYEVGGGPVSGGRVSARLGKRGGLDLRFVPVGKAKTYKVPSWCEGPPYRWQTGYLVGHFAFRGERDYTRARGHRLPAARESWPPARCHYASRPHHHPAKEARVRLGAWSFEGRGMNFGAALFHHDARPLDERVEFTASLSERSGPVWIDREVAVPGPEDSIAFLGRPQVSETATVTPPAPFTGTATFTRTHESTFTWTGDLAVAFPGIAPVRLAGPRFGARLCTLEGCISRNQERNLGEG